MSVVDLTHKFRAQERKDLEQLQVLILKYPWMAKAMALSKGAEELLSICTESKHGVYSCEISNRFNISVESAWGRLNDLYKKGYLAKTPEVAESGGTEYRWFALVNLGKV